MGHVLTLGLFIANKSFYLMSYKMQFALLKQKNLCNIPTICKSV